MVCYDFATGRVSAVAGLSLPRSGVFAVRPATCLVWSFDCEHDWLRRLSALALTRIL